MMDAIVSSFLKEEGPYHERGGLFLLPSGRRKRDDSRGRGITVTKGRKKRIHIYSQRLIRMICENIPGRRELSDVGKGGRTNKKVEKEEPQLGKKKSNISGNCSPLTNVRRGLEAGWRKLGRNVRKEKLRNCRKLGRKRG